MFGENARVNEVPERNFWRLGGCFREEKERKKNRKY
jgi:hypothetical protein